MQIAQVHRATLLDGQEVVVKVQHDGIKTVILEVCQLSSHFRISGQYGESGFCNGLDFYYFQDLKSAKAIVDWIAWAEPQYNFNPMIDEWCKEAPKELDFNHEAGI